MAGDPQGPFWLHPDPDSPFPPVEHALRDPDGLLAIGGDLTPQRLLRAYRAGIFPWYSEGQPILWWSPDPRMVLLPGALHVSRSLCKTLRRQRFRLSMDQAFEEVITACAAPRRDDAGTWITDEMRIAYCRLHQRGHAHSVEAWQAGELVGGLYGVALGGVFFGESMFSRVSDASKVAFVHLVRQLERWGFGLVDCQVHTGHLARLGARPIPRTEFMQRLRAGLALPGRPGHWTFDDET